MSSRACLRRGQPCPGCLEPLSTTFHHFGPLPQPPCTTFYHFSPLADATNTTFYHFCPLLTTRDHHLTPLPTTRGTVQTTFDHFPPLLTTATRCVRAELRYSMQMHDAWYPYVPLPLLRCSWQGLHIQPGALMPESGWSHTGKWMSGNGGWCSPSRGDGSEARVCCVDKLAGQIPLRPRFRTPCPFLVPSHPR